MTEIRTTLGVLAGAEHALNRLATRQLPLKAAYHLTKLVKLTAEELKFFYDSRNEAVKELGTERETTPAERAAGQGPTVLAVTPENMPEFSKRMNELAAVEAALAWGPLDLTPLTALVISAEELAQLGPLVTFSDEEGKSI